MRRLGAVLIIIGVNVAAASLAGAFWHAAFECAHYACKQGVLMLFVQILFSGHGMLYWIVVMMGLLLVWRGKVLRNRSN